MNQISLNLDRVNETAMTMAKKLGVDDAVSLAVLENEQMTRFANDSLTTANRINETALFIYLTKGKRRIVGASSNPEDSSVREFVRTLFKSLMTLTAEPNYAPLPSTVHRYSPSTSRYDERIGELEREIPEYTREAIDAAREAGAERSAGAIEASMSSYHILTSTGTRGEEISSKILLNIRSFSDGDASGHGLSSASNLGRFDPSDAGRTAGEHAKKMANRSQPEEGEYQILMNPTVAANLISLVGSFASAFSVDAGTSYLAGRLNSRVASKEFSLTDHGYVEGCLGGRSFDDEGLPTQSTDIIREGVLKNYLHNLTTAKKFKAKSTGNAGWIQPNAWNVVVPAGDSDYGEMVASMKNGIILTNSWYTRFTNYRTGEFSTVPRDGAYLVRNGDVKTPLSGLRMSDSLERLLSSIMLMSKERKWVEWWEVDIPTLTPWVLVDGVKITRAFG